MPRPRRNPYQIKRALRVAQYIESQKLTMYSVAKKMHEYFFVTSKEVKELSRMRMWLKELKAGHIAKPSKKYILALSYALARRSGNPPWKLGMSIEERDCLTEAIRQHGYNIKFDDPNNLATIYAQLSQLPNFYELWRQKNRAAVVPGEVKKLIKSTRSYRGKEFSSLTDGQKKKIRQLNWVIFKETYSEYLENPLQSPASDNITLEDESTKYFIESQYFILACKFHFLPMISNNEEKIKYHESNWYVEVKRDPLFATYFVDFYDCIELEDIAIDVAEILGESSKTWEDILRKLEKDETAADIIAVLEDKVLPTSPTAFYILTDNLVYRELLNDDSDYRWVLTHRNLKIP